MTAIKRPLTIEPSINEAHATAMPSPDHAWADWQRERLKDVRAGLARPAILDRPTLLDALNSAIREAIAGGKQAAAVLLDLNSFVEINASWGTSFGDEILAAVAERLAEFSADRISRGAPPVPVGRLDADHFVIIVPEMVSLEGLRHDVVELVRSLAKPFSVGGKNVGVSSRAVIVQVPAHGHSVTSVLGRGFRLLNTAARVKTDGVAISETEAGLAASAAMLERDLAAALSTDQLFLALQPKVDVKTGAVRGAEALARWQHPERGLLPPPTFIQAAEKSGLIFDLGLRILRDACRAGNKLTENGRHLEIAVNVSPHQLSHPDFLGRFLEVIDREGIAPELLEIELTETAAMMGGDKIGASLESLRRCGVGIAIDDFGTGFSNLAALSSLPVDTLKIDRSLVTGAEQGGKAGALLDIAVQLGRTFGLATIAEGVETTAQYERVSALGCDMIQGYFTGRPVRSNEFADYYLRK